MTTAPEPRPYTVGSLYLDNYQMPADVIARIVKKANKEGRRRKAEYGEKYDLAPAMVWLTTAMHGVTRMCDWYEDHLALEQNTGELNPVYPIALRLAGFPPDVMANLTNRSILLTAALREGTTSDELAKCTGDEVLIWMAALEALCRFDEGQMDIFLPPALRRDWDAEESDARLTEYREMITQDEDVAMFWAEDGGAYEMSVRQRLVYPEMENWFTLFRAGDDLPPPVEGPDLPTFESIIL